MRKLTVSVSELISFQSCRRRWRLSREWDKPTSTPALWFGDGIHKALEAYNNVKKANPQATHDELIAAMGEAFEAWHTRQYEKLKKEFGMLWAQGAPAFENMVDIGWQILKNYADYDRSAPIQFRPLLVEKLMYIPLDDGDYISLKMDIIAEATERGSAIGTGPVDNKTSNGRHATGQVLDTDEQMTGYAWAYWKITSQVPDFIGYNVLAKEVPATPMVLKGGGLSKDKRQKTTHALYLQALKDQGLDETDYEEILTLLEAKGWDGFFEREISPRSLEQIKNFEKRTKLLMTEMRRCLEDPQLAYPSFSPLKCPGCPFLTVCNAMETDEDHEYLLETSYVRKVADPWEKRKRDMERNA